MSSRLAHTERLAISFDLDRTLDFGDPSGPIVPALIGALQDAAAIVGSASDRTVLDQRRMWERAGIGPPAFAVAKAQLRTVPAAYPDHFLVHIGDRFADHLEAVNAGAFFIHVDTFSLKQWSAPDHLYDHIMQAHARSGPHGAGERSVR
ncbi:MAG: hypothetical protein EXR68_05395 [Dehalococcoidia bacterium]|nr:hypothetical protein [Dehalococcoidia bacterium]